MFFKLAWNEDPLWNQGGSCSILAELVSKSTTDFGQPRIVILTLRCKNYRAWRGICVQSHEGNSFIWLANFNILNYGAALLKYGPWHHQLQMTLERYKRLLHVIQLPKFTCPNKQGMLIFQCNTYLQIKVLNTISEMSGIPSIYTIFQFS